MEALSQRIVPWVAYPATMTFVVTLHYVLLDSGLSVAMAGYIPVFIGAAAVTMLEWRFPYEKTWHPPGTDIRNDLLYMVVIQMVFPRVLALMVALAIVDLSRGHPTGLWGLWPHDLPVWLQAIMMILIADFFRYWLHRASHEVPLLWRFHAVHHSVPRLYWLNVGRFHPIDKFLQFLFDTFPFILLGVRADVITLYFVFYAVNGFFQHSNINLRYGVLNYLISGAELHRWHHSRKPVESNTNYGNNIIIWDLLFGTWFLPRDRRVNELGLINRYYPLRFWQQMGTPFTPDIIYRDVPLQRFNRVLGRWQSWLVMQGVRFIGWRRLWHDADDPEAAQARVLARIVSDNRETRFGNEHGFSEIGDYTDFFERVPVQDYESLRPYILEQETEKTPALTAEQPFMYAVTSGTTGEPKYLPVLESTLAEFRQEQRLLAYSMFRYCPMAFTGKVLVLAGPAVEGYRPSGAPYGSVSGQLYAHIPHIMQLNNVLPPAVHEIADAGLKYLIILRLALAEPCITQMVGANPSSFLRLLELLNRHRDQLTESLERGGAGALGALPSGTDRSLKRSLSPAPAMARRLREAPGDRQLNYFDLWPELRLLTVWTGGSCGVALESLKDTLPEGIKIMELGYLSSEFRGTVTVEPRSGSGIPTLHHNFFEFIEPEKWENGEHRFLRLHELEQDRNYYVIVTTGAGLYRYFMNDIVRVNGRFANTPTVNFLQKGRGVTNITGEKLYESQLLQAVDIISSRYGINPVFIMCLADEQASLYRLYLEIRGNPPDSRNMEAIAEDIDGKLADLNIEYEAKRKSGRLAPLRFYLLRHGTGEAYKGFCLRQGQKEGQFKTIALQMKSHFGFSLDQYVIDAGHGDAGAG